MKFRKKILAGIMAALVFATSIPLPGPDTAYAAAAPSTAVTMIPLVRGQFLEPDGTFAARGTERVRLEVRSSSDYLDITGGTYTWVTVDDAGVETVIPGAVNSSYYAAITDYSIIYRCKAVVRTSDGNTYTQSFDYKPVPSAGYLLRDISDYMQTADIGEQVVLSADVIVDVGYNVEYRWDKVERDDAGNLAMVQDSNTTNTFTIPAVTSKDFESVNVSSIGNNATHILTITVSDGQGYTEARTFYFNLTERTIAQTTNMLPTYNDTSVANHPVIDEHYYDYKVNRGDDVELFWRKKDVDTTYVVTWYKAISVIDFIYVLEADGNYRWVPEDPDIVAPVADFSLTSYVNKYNFISGNHVTTKRIEYYKAVGNNTETLHLTGGAYSPGTYVCSINETKNHITNMYGMFKRNVIYDTDLTAYAKHDEVDAYVGSPAKLQVVANDCDQTLFPITYTWYKKDASGDYLKVDGITGAVYDIASVDASMYGEYRVLVSNGYESTTADVKLVVPKDESYFETPESSYFEVGVGDPVILEVTGKSLRNAQYVWYKTEKYVSSNYLFSADHRNTVDWQILGQNEAKYTFVADEKNRTTYKCDAIYIEDGIQKVKTFVFFVQDDEDATVMATTANTQYCKVGDTATYGVQVVSANPGVTTEKSEYQWQRYDMSKDEYVDIAGANASVYSAKLENANCFGWVRCLISYSKGHDPKFVYFSTELATDVTFGLDVNGNVANFEVYKVEKGANITVVPNLINPSNRQLTYQWYRGYEGGKKLHGSNQSAYTISDIAENDCGVYSCIISQDGIEILTYVVTIELDDSNDIVMEIADGYSKDVEAILGRSASFAVKVTQKKENPFYYQWYVRYKGYDGSGNEAEDLSGSMNTSDLAGHGWIAIGGASSDKYTINKAIYSDCGEYMCIARNNKGHEAYVVFNLNVSTGIKVDSGYENSDDVAGYATTIGGTVTLNAVAGNMNSGYGIFYNWFKYNAVVDKYMPLENASGSSYTINVVAENDLGYYLCKVYDGLGNMTDLTYKVYVNSGLIVTQSLDKPIAAADGKVKMSVDATVNAGTNVFYQWQKLTMVDGVARWISIEGATNPVYEIGKLTKADYGSYRAITQVPGDMVFSFFDLGVIYDSTINRQYAEQGDEIVVKAGVANKAADGDYRYVWYAEDPATGSLKRVENATPEYRTTAPTLVNPISWYDTMTYKCKIYDGDPSDERNLIHEIEENVNVLATVNYKRHFPETSHPTPANYDVQGYVLSGAKGISVTVDKKSAPVIIIDDKGNTYHACGDHRTVKFQGNKAIIIYTGDSTYDEESNIRDYSYGYRVNTIQSAYRQATLKPKTITYTGRQIKIDNAALSLGKGSITYTYYKDVDCTEALIVPPINAGTYYVVAHVKENAEFYETDSLPVRLVIKKASSRLKISRKSKSISASSLRRKAQTFSIGAKAITKVSCKKLSGNKNLSINSKKGIVTVKKNTRKGIYSMRVKVSAKGDKNHKSGSKVITVKVSVR